MSKVDWSLAPDDATHFGQGADCGYWVKIHGARQYFINISRWDNGKWKESPEPEVVSLLVERPRKPWSGPEDGLPPVGTVCEYQTIGATNDWQEVEILCHFTAQKEVAVFVPVKGYRNVKQAIAECFRPIQTPEQIASDNRETAIRDVMDIAQVDCRVTAARLVDAGFKREVV